MLSGKYDRMGEMGTKGESGNRGDFRLLWGKADTASPCGEGYDA